MVNMVTKNDGTKAPFDAEKMKGSIMAACQDAGVSDEEKNNITQKVSAVVMAQLENKEEISSAEIKKMILSELDVSFPEIAQAWRAYDEGKTV